jgi:hypothetical protein
LTRTRTTTAGEWVADSRWRGSGLGCAQTPGVVCAGKHSQRHCRRDASTSSIHEAQPAPYTAAAALLLHATPTTRTGRLRRLSGRMLLTTPGSRCRRMSRASCAHWCVDWGCAVVWLLCAVWLFVASVCVEGGAADFCSPRPQQWDSTESRDINQVYSLQLLRPAASHYCCYCYAVAMLLLSCSQDATAELRARRQRALSAAQSARIRKGMIRYLVLVRQREKGEEGSAAQGLGTEGQSGCRWCVALTGEKVDAWPAGRAGSTRCSSGTEWGGREGEGCKCQRARRQGCWLLLAAS